MNRFLSLPVFSLTFAIGYTWAVLQNYPLFRYYPLVKRFSWVDLADKTLGPAMAWYGWMAIAAIPAFVIAVIWKFVVPERVTTKLWPLFYLVPIMLLVATYYREKNWIGL